MKVLRALGLASMVATCACGEHASLSAPSPVIVPDVATISVGEAQTFVVLNAAVQQFSLVAVGRPWNECLAVNTAQVVNSIRIQATATCRGIVYVSAELGTGRSPLVAVMSIR